MAFDFTDLEGQRFQADLQQAAGYKPLIRKDLKEAYGRYKDVGVKMGRVKGKSDAQLYKQATNDVLKWWKLQKAKPDPKGTSPNNSGQPGSSVTPPSSSSGNYYSGGGGSGGGGGSMLPDTAMGSGGSTRKLPTLQTRADPNYVKLQLARNGFTGVMPPAYALKTVDAFDAWLERALRLRAGQTAAPAPTTDYATGDSKTTGTSGGARTV